jgi:hypothetical protein
VSGRIAAILMWSLAMSAWGRNVDLSTVPKRATVQLTIYNSEDLTLVRETRSITFKKGANPLQFSWANTLIDPTSVELKFLSNPEKLEVLDTTFPHDKPQVLYWNVQSDFDGEATVEISYFTSGISWGADYVAVADKDERQMGIDGFVRVTNNSGEDYEDAKVRLVVGTINLVEKIAQLAQIPVANLSRLEDAQKNYYRFGAMRRSLDRADRDFDDYAAAPTTAVTKPKEIVKEGLSEYFIYSIEGTETVRTGWSKRMRSFAASAVPMKIQYRYRPAEYGEQLVRMYLMTNDKDSKLGTTPLPDGVVRVLRDNGRNGLSFLASQHVKYIPIGDKVELNLGRDPNVIFELIKLRTSRDEIWMRGNGANVFLRVGQPGVQIRLNAAVAGWDDHEVYAQRVRNYTAKPIEVEVRRTFPGHVVFRSALKPMLFDFQTPQFTAMIDAGKKSDLLFEIVRHQGQNAKQNNVTLESAEIAP